MSKKRNESKLGRNSPCPCGSGEKYKNCHLGKIPLASGGKPDKEMIQMVAMQREKSIAKQRQRESQQGLGNPIISLDHNGRRIIAIKHKIYYADNWNTFHDFLIDYLPILFTKEWFIEESKKDQENRNIIVSWGLHLKNLQKSQSRGEKGNIRDAKMDGPIQLYLWLSYNLYLLEHNSQIQKLLVKRLKNKSQVEDALFETMVVGLFIRSGFTVVPEDESDTSTSHCEFIATHKKTKKQFSIEVKNRKFNKDNNSIWKQLKNALKKRCDDERIVFINLNKKTSLNQAHLFDWEEDVLKQLRDAQEKLQIDDSAAPSSYVFVSNIPISMGLEFCNMPMIPFGFRINDFDLKTPASVRKQVETRESHYEIFDLMKGIRTYTSIPVTFDGTLPELSFKGEKQEFVVGKRIEFEMTNGEKVVGVLKHAVVNPNEKNVYCVMILDDKREVIVSTPLTESELLAYDKNPNNFVIQRQSGTKLEDGDVLGIFDWLYGVYSKSTKATLLEQLKLPQKEGATHTVEYLARELSIRYAEIMIANQQKKIRDDSK